MTIFRERITWYTIIIFTCLSFVAWAQTAHAVERSIQLHFSVTDQFGSPLGTSPQVQLSDCGVYKTDIAQLKAGSQTDFSTTLYYDSKDASDNCFLQISSPGFLSSSIVNLGNIESSVNFTVVQPIKLTYALVVEVKNRQNESLVNMDVFVGGVAPRVRSGGTYYFAPRSPGALEISHPAYIKRSGVTDPIFNNISTTSQEVTRVTIGGTSICNKSNNGRIINCAGMETLFSVDANDELGNIFYDGTVKIYSDVGRTKIARAYMGGVTGDAQKTVFSDMTQVALLPGSYYLKVSRVKYEELHKKITVTAGESQKFVANMAREHISHTSSLRSVVKANRINAQANGIDTIGIDVEVRSSDNSLLKNKKITLDTGNETDVILFPEGNVTGTNGSIKVYVTATEGGFRTLQAWANDVLIADFPVIHFEASAGFGSVDTHTSEVNQTPSPILADGIEDVTLSIVAKNSSGGVLSDKSVAASSNRTASDAVVCDPATDAFGKATCTFSSTGAGTSILTVSVDDVIIDKIAISISPIVES